MCLKINKLINLTVYKTSISCLYNFYKSFIIEMPRASSGSKIEPEKLFINEQADHRKETLVTGLDLCL